MNMKQMPYKVPDGFMEMSRMRNRAAIYRAATEQTKHKRNAGVRWAMSIVAMAACLIIGIIGYMKFDRNADEMVQLVAQMQNASADILCDMASDYVYYSEDVSLL